MEGTKVVQLFIDDNDDIVKDSFHATGSNAIKILKKIWDVFAPHHSIFENISNYELLFDTLLKILARTSIQKEDSPFYPYLLNAHTLDSKLQLPFINLEGESIELVSIMEVNV